MQIFIVAKRYVTILSSKRKPELKDENIPE